MDGLDEFLSRLLTEGRVVLGRRPISPTSPERAIERLGRAYASYRLEVAGPPIPFDGPVALEAAERLAAACRALVIHDERPDDLARRLAMTHPPRSAAQHLSADLVFRYVPQVYRRARGIAPADPLVGLLAALLRAWPLSGVLAGLEEGPSSPPDFDGHEGLMLLYAERWARHKRPAWRPEGKALEFVELVAGSGEA